jgi:hypothetical protein
MSRIVEQFAEEVGHIWSEHHAGADQDPSRQDPTRPDPSRQAGEPDGAPQRPPSDSRSQPRA